MLRSGGLRDVIADRFIDETVLAGLMRHFGVSYSALLYRLSSPLGNNVSAHTAHDTWPKSRFASYSGRQTTRHPKN
jgi:uncharacterized protein YidB (DUF937 family)